MPTVRLIPLIILIVVVVIVAAVGYVAWSIAQEVTRNTRSKMEKKNVVWTRDGMKVGVKEIRDEEYKDRSQRCVPSFPGPALMFRRWSSPTSSYGGVMQVRG